MILVDTSVWIDHLRKSNAELVALLGRGVVCIHEFVIGELACGNLRNRPEILAYLRNLSRTPVASMEEMLLFMDRRKLMGRGLGYVDANLLASSAIGGAPLWTMDKSLHTAASECGLALSRPD